MKANENNNLSQTGSCNPKDRQESKRGWIHHNNKRNMNYSIK